MIPRAFVKDWRHEFGDTVRVITYDGIIATIKLETINGKFYLTDRWEQFFDHHNLYNDYCLMFEYTENSTFNVVVMDDSGLEVKYESDIFEEGEESNNSNMDNPAFKVKLTPHKYGHRKIFIPRRFANQHWPKFVRSVQIHDSSHQNWDITTNLRPNGVVQCLTIRWAHFPSMKELEMDGTCIFELLNNESPEFLVYKKKSQ
ncbi:B3 domain-containing protein Os03g0622100-like [Olea europaea var. sylvestris]|uniref:B3 domain-containing protein Os03g0622100-like n=1 Tax=Olea europaea var. sylvestris TaxID=158386 RepID=UPI000C1D14AE|nr:B3 domain-containing protein Os03g0622100-like [Olea europaea var. sylvestris]